MDLPVREPIAPQGERTPPPKKRMALLIVENSFHCNGSPYAVGFSCRGLAAALPCGPVALHFLFRKVKCVSASVFFRYLVLKNKSVSAIEGVYAKLSTTPANQRLHPEINAKTIKRCKYDLQVINSEKASCL